MVVAVNSKRDTTTACPFQNGVILIKLDMFKVCGLAVQYGIEAHRFMFLFDPYGSDHVNDLQHREGEAECPNGGDRDRSELFEEKFGIAKQQSVRLYRRIERRIGKDAKQNDS